MKVKSRVNPKKYTGSYQYTITLIKDGGIEEALINLLESLPKGRKTEHLRQRLLGAGNSGSQPSMGGVSLPVEGKQKPNIRGLYQAADEDGL